MAASSRFAVAVHILTLLEHEGGRPVPSVYIAGSVHTNPGVVRRLLAQLGRAGLVTARLGAGGGTSLARPAARIRVVDVYRAVESGALFPMHRATPNPHCPVGRHIQATLTRVIGRADTLAPGGRGGDARPRHMAGSATRP
jgi:DNA-binding IscR family transcriptional regulator